MFCTAVWRNQHRRANERRRRLHLHVGLQSRQCTGFDYQPYITYYQPLGKRFDEREVREKYADNLIVENQPSCVNCIYFIRVPIECLHIDRSVQSFNRMFYTWENPAGPRKIIWEDNNGKEFEDKLRKVKTLERGREEAFAHHAIRKRTSFVFFRTISVPSYCQK